MLGEQKCVEVNVRERVAILGILFIFGRQKSVHTIHSKAKRTTPRNIKSVFRQSLLVVISSSLASDGVEVRCDCRGRVIVCCGPLGYDRPIPFSMIFRSKKFF